MKTVIFVQGTFNASSLETTWKTLGAFDGIFKFFCPGVCVWFPLRQDGEFYAKVYFDKFMKTEQIQDILNKTKRIFKKMTGHSFYLCGAHCVDDKTYNDLFSSSIENEETILLDKNSALTQEKLKDFIDEDEKTLSPQDIERLKSAEEKRAKRAAKRNR